MKNVSFYNDRGEIISVCNCIDDNALQATIEANNYQYIYGEYNPSEFYIDNGVAVRFPDKPDSSYVWDWDAKQWQLNLEQLTTDAIKQRNKLLQDSDWTMLPDTPTDKDAWAVYRQHLRDITQQQGFPIKIDWGTAPSKE